MTVVAAVDDILHPPSRRRDDELVTHLVQTVATVVTDDPSAMITVRSLAKAAGVDQRVVARRFGDTRSLELLTLERSLDQLLASANGAHPLPPAGAIFDDPVRWYLITRLALDPGRPNRLAPFSRFVRSLVDREHQLHPELDRTQAEMATTLSLSAEVGAALFSPGFCKPFGLGADDPVIRTTLISLIEDLRARTGSFSETAPPLRIDHDRWSRARTKRWRSQTRGRDNVEDRLVHAGATLLVEQRPSAISGRELAMLAQVNYGLIHHYFGSKNAVLRQSLAWLRRQALIQVSNPEAGPGEPIGAASLARAMANMALDGLSDSPDGEFPGLDRFVRRLGDTEALAARTRATAFLSLTTYFAWVLLEDLMAPALDGDPDELHAAAMGQMAQTIRRR